MKTIYKCDVCGFTSESFDAVVSCEGMGKLAIELNEVFGTGGWRPPKPVHEFATWTHGDRLEMARRIDAFFSKHYKF